MTAAIYARKSTNMVGGDSRRALAELPYEELVQRDKCSLDIFWLRDESLEDSQNLPAPDLIAAEIIEDLRAALEQFVEIQSDLSRKPA